MPWLRPFVAGLSPQRLRFHPTLVHLVFVVNKVTLGHVYLLLFWVLPVLCVLLTVIDSPINNTLAYGNYSKLGHVLCGKTQSKDWYPRHSRSFDSTILWAKWEKKIDFEGQFQRLFNLRREISRRNKCTLHITQFSARDIFRSSNVTLQRHN